MTGSAKAIGIVPFGIGMTVLGFLWLTPFNQFGSPPLFFRIFGSFIALAFVMTGVAIFKGAGMHPGNHLHGNFNQMRRSMGRPGPVDGPAEPSASSETPQVGYDCPNCGAALGDDADVSPGGDVKCVYCKRWFNIHQA